MTADPNAEPAPVPEQESKALQVVNWIVKQAIAGAKVLKPAAALADEYMASEKFKTPGEQIDALIGWSRLQNFTTGFATGMGGLLTLPVTLPAGLASAFVIQARMAAAIARIAGHDIETPAVQSFVSFALLGGGATDLLKGAGIQPGARLTKEYLGSIPGKLLVELNKQVGLRLLTKAGTSGVVNLTKFIPLVGGVIGGTVDQWYCSQVGRAAKKMFLEEEIPADATPPATGGEPPPTAGVS